MQYVEILVGRDPGACNLEIAAGILNTASMCQQRVQSIQHAFQIIPKYKEVAVQPGFTSQSLNSKLLEAYIYMENMLL